MSDTTPHDERAALRARARAFAVNEVAPHAGAWDRAHAMPREIITRMGELGFLAGPLPIQHGGGGFDNESFVAVYEEIGRACSSTRGFLAVHTGLVSQCLFDHGSEEQRERWLPRLASGEFIGCYGLTEDGAGSDVGAIASTAEQDGDNWVLHGSKVWITNGGVADLGVLFARTGPEPGRRGLTAFVVELPQPGFSAEGMGVEPLGHRASNHVRLSFDGLVIPDSQRLGQIGQGFSIAMSALDHGRIGVAAGAVGIARACLDEAVAHAQERRQFGQRIGDFQMVQADLADIYSETEAAAALVARAARAADEHSDDLTRLTSAAKLFATEVAQRAATKAVLLLGNRGYGDGHSVERHYRDIQGLRIYEGTNHIQRLIIGRSLVGRPPKSAPSAQA
ncbi:MAG: alkylation response protein AidB-like acyl-CoA dehydrogenase [Pseudohongiellaceae bacterium]|jgi:alkylation response protein AidB-like acyl-CoA dehydrogenase